MDNKIQIPSVGVPVSAQWGKDITQRVNAISLRGGRGTLSSSDVSGSNISILGYDTNTVNKPIIFDLKLAATEHNTMDLYMYCGVNPTCMIRRNGYQCTPTGLSPNYGNWSKIEESIGMTSTYYVTAMLGDKTKSGGPSSTYEINVSTTEPTAALAVETGMINPVTIGTINSGKIEQLHRGELSTYHTLLDAELGDTLGYYSLAYKDNDQRAQLYEFDDLYNQTPVDYPDDATDIDVVVRIHTSKGAKIGYVKMSSLFGGDTTSSDYDEESDDDSLSDDNPLHVSDGESDGEPSSENPLYWDSISEDNPLLNSDGESEGESDGEPSSENPLYWDSISEDNPLLNSDGDSDGDSDGESDGYVAPIELPDGTVIKWDVVHNTVDNTLVQYWAKWSVATKTFVKDAVTAPVLVYSIPAVPVVQIPDQSERYGQVFWDVSTHALMQHVEIYTLATNTWAVKANADVTIDTAESHSSQHA